MARKISAKEIVNDIRAGADDKVLTEKYEISNEKLQKLFKLLLEKGLITESELDRGSSLPAGEDQVVSAPPAVTPPASRSKLRIAIFSFLGILLVGAGIGLMKTKKEYDMRNEFKRTVLCPCLQRTVEAYYQLEFNIPSEALEPLKKSPKANKAFWSEIYDLYRKHGDRDKLLRHSQDGEKCREQRQKVARKLLDDFLEQSPNGEKKPLDDRRKGLMLSRVMSGPDWIMEHGMPESDKRLLENIRKKTWDDKSARSGCGTLGQQLKEEFYYGILPDQLNRNQKAADFYGAETREGLRKHVDDAITNLTTWVDRIPGMMAIIKDGHDKERRMRRVFNSAAYFKMHELILAANRYLEPVRTECPFLTIQPYED